MYWTALIALLVMLPVTSHAEDQFYQSKDQGWHFYNEIPPEEEPKPEKKKPEQPPAPKQVTKKEEPKKAPEPAQYSGPPPLSAAWLKVNLPKYLNAAIDNPTPANVSAYLYLQKVAMNKTQAFSDMAKMVSTTNPSLDELTRRPFMTSGTTIAGAVSERASDLLLKKMSKTMGIWYFYTANSPYDPLGEQIAAAYQRNYGFSVLAISIDGTPPKEQALSTNWTTDQGQSQKLQVAQIPAFYLVNAETKDYVSVGQGPVSNQEMKERLLLAAYYKGWITKDEYETGKPMNNLPDLKLNTATLSTDKDGFVPPEQIANAFEKQGEKP